MTGAARLASALAALAAAASTPAAGAASGHPIDYDPVFSPDGRTIAFVRETVAGSSADSAIMLVRLNGRGLRVLLPHVLASGLRWSADGTSLAYSMRGIWIVKVATGETRQLTTNGGEPSWSPDGRTIAYTHGENCFGCASVWFVGADGSNDRQLVSRGRRPVFSPDGTMLSLSFAQNFVIDLNGNGVIPVGSRGQYTPYTEWSPSGTNMVHTGDGLWIVDIATRHSRRLTPFVNEKPSWSPDGTVIAGGRHRFVVLVRVKDGKIVARFPKSNIERGEPSWSPRGELAFVHLGNCGIDLAHEDGSHLRRITRTC